MIASPRHPALRELRRLRRHHDEDRCLLEGPHLVAEAVAAGLALERVLVTPEFLGGAEGQALAAILPQPPELIASELLATVTDAGTPRGALAVARLPRPGPEGLPAQGDLFLYAEGIQDPGNLGALARVAEATGARGLALSPGSAHPNHPRAQRAAAGSLLRLPVAIATSPGALSRHLGAVDWVGLAPRGGRSLWEAPLTGRLVVALGAEGPGLSPGLAKRCGLLVTIPLRPPVESLNVTVAAAVALYEIARRRPASTS